MNIRVYIYIYIIHGPRPEEVQRIRKATSSEGGARRNRRDKEKLPNNYKTARSAARRGAARQSEALPPHCPSARFNPTLGA